MSRVTQNRGQQVFQGWDSPENLEEKMTFKQLALQLCKKEGGKEQVDIAQMRQVLKQLKKIFKKNPIGVLKVLFK